jgi:uncharacterized protein (DUF362 family)
MTESLIAIVHEAGAAGPDLLDRAIRQAGLREAMGQRIATALERKDSCSAVIVPALDAFAAGSPAATAPALVEHLLDLLFELGVTEAAVGSTRGTAALWLENRDVFMVADLLGYRYETPAGRPYDVIDLSEDVTAGVFGEAGPLAGTGLARAWLEADLRLVFSANRTDEDDGYALCLSTLLSVLPQTDKDYHYRHRRDPGEVIAALLAVAPVHFSFIDAIISGHGAGGGRAPTSLATDTIIAATDPALADYLGAMKMGLDPFVSKLAAPSLRRARPTPQTRILGSLERYPAWVNVSPALIASTTSRRASLSADRSVRPVLQQVDRELFPFRDPVNDWLNNALSEAASAGGDGALLAMANFWLGEVGKAAETFGVIADKDALRRREAPINIDTTKLRASDFDDLAAELLGQAALLRGVPADADGVRWRFDDGAILFDGARRMAQPFENFTAAVDICRTIQFMNDYIGGQALVTRRDKRGRTTRQVERNLYLPQPNYTAIGGGVTIDVTKIETIEYTPRRQRMFWKTVKSENDSAIADDGVVTFEALGEDTLVTIWGRQHFRLPPMWAAIDQSLDPAMKQALVSQAYAQFFNRTFANLEAVSEGRDMRIGKPWADAPEGEALPVERLSGLVRRVQSEGHLDIPAALKGALTKAGGGKLEPLRIDADGFRHFDGTGLRSPASENSPLKAAIRDLQHAARVDAGTAR